MIENRFANICVTYFVKEIGNAFFSLQKGMETMHYSKNERLYEIEKMMRGIPNFMERGCGSVVLQSDMRDSIEEQPPPSSYAQALQMMVSAVRYQPLDDRLKEYIAEREMEQMNYRSVKHKEVFEEIVSKMDKKNNAFISAVYLMTADFDLWQVMKHHTDKNTIDFESPRLKGIGEKGYTLYCVAKDLYLGTKHLSISDLADKELISKKMFALICNAMAIRRFGIKAMELAEEMN